MNPAASIPPAPAASPGALARASGRLTRRRKVVVAIEIALIAAILAFAWMRGTPLSRSSGRLIGEAKSVAACFPAGMTWDEGTATIERLLRERPLFRWMNDGFSYVPDFDVGYVKPPERSPKRELAVWESGPALRHGLARAMMDDTSNTTGRAPAVCWIILYLDENECVARTVVTATSSMKD